MCVVVGILISRTITSIPIAIMFATPFLMAAIATPFLMAIIVAAPVTPAMAVAMISEC